MASLKMAIVVWRAMRQLTANVHQTSHVPSQPPSRLGKRPPRPWMICEICGHCWHTRCFQFAEDRWSEKGALRRLLETLPTFLHRSQLCHCFKCPPPARPAVPCISSKHQQQHQQIQGSLTLTPLPLNLQDEANDGDSQASTYAPWNQNRDPAG